MFVCVWFDAQGTENAPRERGTLGRPQEDPQGGRRLAGRGGRAETRAGAALGAFPGDGAHPVSSVADAVVAGPGGGRGGVHEEEHAQAENT